MAYQTSVETYPDLDNRTKAYFYVIPLIKTPIVILLPR